MVKAILCKRIYCWFNSNCDNQKSQWRFSPLLFYNKRGLSVFFFESFMKTVFRVRVSGRRRACCKIEMSSSGQDMGLWLPYRRFKSCHLSQLQQDRVMVTRLAHNQKIEGSSPSPAPNSGVCPRGLRYLSWKQTMVKHPWVQILPLPPFWKGRIVGRVRRFAKPLNLISSEGSNPSLSSKFAVIVEWLRRCLSRHKPEFNSQ